MYEHLMARMDARGITRRQLAELLGRHLNSINNKLAGATDFTLQEAMKIATLFPGETIETLFVIEEDTTKKKRRMLPLEG